MAGSPLRHASVSTWVVAAAAAISSADTIGRRATVAGQLACAATRPPNGRFAATSDAPAYTQSGPRQSEIAP